MSRASELADGNEKCAAAWKESSDAHKFRMDTAAELRRLDRVNAELVEECQKAEQVYAHLKMWPLLDQLRAALTSATKEQQK